MLMVVFFAGTSCLPQKRQRARYAAIATTTRLQAISFAGLHPEFS